MKISDLFNSIQLEWGMAVKTNQGSSCTFMMLQFTNKQTLKITHPMIQVYELQDARCVRCQAIISHTMSYVKRNKKS